MTRLCTAFEGSTHIAAGDLAQVALKVKRLLARGERAPVLVFDDASGEVIDMDLRGTEQEVPATVEEEPRRPGRPKLGVVAREVTLLPRHWDWLNSQPGGASVTLRKLVEAARRASASGERVRQAQDSAYRFMTAMAGNEPGYEEALRALFAGRRERFEEAVGGWPADVREHASKLAEASFPKEGE